MATLTEEILLRIEIYGGRYKVIEAIENEWTLEERLSKTEQGRINAMQKWSANQIRLLKLHFKKIPMDDLIKIIGKTENAIYHKVRQMQKLTFQ